MHFTIAAQATSERGCRLRKTFATSRLSSAAALGGLARWLAACLSSLATSPKPPSRKYAQPGRAPLRQLLKRSTSRIASPSPSPACNGPRRNESWPVSWGAIGDALGYEVEFNNLRQIRERFGQSGIKTSVSKQGKLIVSDDTQMTLFTLEGLLQAFAKDAFSFQSCVESIRQAYLDWFETQRGSSKDQTWLVAQPESYPRCFLPASSLINASPLA